LWIVYELNGISCISLEELIEPRKNIVSSRSFGKPVKTYKELSEAVSLYTTSAAERLRRQKLVASAVGVFIRTNHFADAPKKYSNSSIIALETPTAYTPELIKVALQNLNRIFKDKYDYKKAGVYLLDLLADDLIQPNLFNSDFFYNEKKRALMNTIDNINLRFAKNIVKPAAASITNKDNWQMRRERKSPAYTTNWSELPTIMI